MNESIEELIGVEDGDEKGEENKSKYKLDRRQLELLNLISSYVDFYDPDVDIHFDNKNKFVYAVHALNHALK